MSAEAACFPNIGPGEIRKRVRFGVLMLAAGLVLAAVMIAGGVERWWRVALFLPFWLAALGYFQAREKT